MDVLVTNRQRRAHGRADAAVHGRVDERSVRCNRSSCGNTRSHDLQSQFSEIVVSKSAVGIADRSQRKGSGDVYLKRTAAN